MPDPIDTTLIISSPSFKPNGQIPSKYTCEGEGINPPLTITNIPQGTKSMALIVDDPDAPGKTFDHWIVWDIQPGENIKENSVPGIQGRNSAGKNNYTGPCPPSGTHRYFFKLYALDTMMDIAAGASKNIVEKAMENHILAAGEIIGLYEKQRK